MLKHRVLELTKEDGSVERKRVALRETALFLDNRQLVGLSANVNELTCLTGLWLWDNAFAAMPPSVLSMTQLTWLNLDGNRLVEIPREIGRLRALKELYVAFNQLAAVPREIGLLRALERLSVSDNALTSLPSELGHLLALQSFWLKRNLLTCLPLSLGRLPPSTKIFLNGNPLPIDVGPRTGSHDSRARLDEIYDATTWPTVAGIREPAFEVLVALQSLFIPALLLVDLLDAAFPNSIPMHKKWDLVTTVKHFHQRHGIER